jgi:hypothetical protein
MPSPNLRFCSPWELLFHTNPDYSFLKVFGCLCFPLLHPYNKHKLEPHSIECVFLGYALNAKGYLCLNLKTLKHVISRHVVFDESIFPFHSSSSSSTQSSLVNPTNTWLSFVLYFHPCTAPSILGPYLTPKSTPGPPLPPICSTHCPNVTASTSPPSLPSPKPSPLPLPASKSYLMQTRGKSGISKHKLLLHTKIINPLDIEPTSYSVASKYPE